MGFMNSGVPELNISMSEFVLLLSWTTSRGSWCGGVGRRTELLQEPLPNDNTTHAHTHNTLRDAVSSSNSSSSHHTTK